MNVCSKSLIGASQTNRRCELERVMRRCKSNVIRTRTRQNAASKMAPQGKLKLKEETGEGMEALPFKLKTTCDHEAMNQSNDQSVTFDRMLKKYGTGWQTRMVRAQRS